ncbi:MAG: sugar phosphate isomerase/epimerase family protein [Planctomycetota bacterium]|jgi:sugar phosphate isomerase/epimerase
MNKGRTRREFLQAAGMGTAAILAGADASLGQNRRQSGEKRGTGKVASGTQFALGAASYTFRKFKLEDVLIMTRRLGLEYICLKSFHLPLDSTAAQIMEVAAKVKWAGLRLYGGGVIYMKKQAEVNRAFDYAKRAGMTTIVGVPRHDLLGLVDNKVREYDIKVAIHNHGPGDKLYPTPASAYEKIRHLDKRIGLCIDVGHTKRAGVDPAEAAEKLADRLLDVHMKDVSAATARGQTIEIGRGVIDVPRFLRTLLNIRYAGVVSFEHEKDAKDPLPGLSESVGYVRGVLAAV